MEPVCFALVARCLLQSLFEVIHMKASLIPSLEASARLPWPPGGVSCPCTGGWLKAEAGPGLPCPLSVRLRGLQEYSQSVTLLGSGEVRSRELPRGLWSREAASWAGHVWNQDSVLGSSPEQRPCGLLPAARRPAAAGRRRSEAPGRRPSLVAQPPGSSGGGCSQATTEPGRMPGAGLWAQSL